MHKKYNNTENFNIENCGFFIRTISVKVTAAAICKFEILMCKD